MARERMPDPRGDLFGELELIRKIDRFFDRVLYYVLRGYEENSPHHLAAAASAPGAGRPPFAP